MTYYYEIDISGPWTFHTLLRTKLFIFDPSYTILHSKYHRHLLWYIHDPVWSQQRRKGGQKYQSINQSIYTITMIIHTMIALIYIFSLCINNLLNMHEIWIFQNDNILNVHARYIRLLHSICGMKYLSFNGLLKSSKIKDQNIFYFFYFLYSSL